MALASGVGSTPRALALEQRVVAMLAQARQCMADRWLGNVQTLGGTREAAFLVDAVKHHKQIQIHARQ